MLDVIKGRKVQDVTDNDFQTLIPGKVDIQQVEHLLSQSKHSVDTLEGLTDQGLNQNDIRLLSLFFNVPKRNVNLKRNGEIDNASWS